MARRNRVSPIPETHLRKLAELLRSIAGSYEAAADQLVQMGRKSLPVEKFPYLRDGLEALLSHAEQAMDWPMKEELWKAYQQFKDEPLPGESFDRTQTGKKIIDPSAGSPQKTLKAAKASGKKARKPE